MTKRTDKETTNFVWLLGCIALMVVGFIIIPPLIQKIGNKISKVTSTVKDISFENLGPIIDEKEENTEEKCE